MTGSLGFTVTEIVRRTEPVVPDPFVATLSGPRRRRPGARAAGQLAAISATP